MTYYIIGIVLCSLYILYRTYIAGLQAGASLTLKMLRSHAEASLAKERISGFKPKDNLSIVPDKDPRDVQ